MAALLMLIPVADTWPKAWSVAYVMAAQAITGIAKDLNKMSTKGAIRTLIPATLEAPARWEQQLFRWVAILTGFQAAMGAMAGALLLACA